MPNTSYVRDQMERTVADGLDDGLRQMVEDDARMLEDLGVSSDRERNLAFYLEHFLDDLLVEAGVDGADRMTVVRSAFGELRSKDDVELTDIRRAVFRALGRRKLAYPNTMGVMEGNVKPERDISKWVHALGGIQSAEHAGSGHAQAVDANTEEWDPVEKTDFQQWLRYYERGDHEKYASLGKIAAGELPSPPPAVPVVQPPVAQLRGRRRPEDKTSEENRRALVSRLDAAKRLLRALVKQWPPNVWNRLYQSLSDLEQEVIGLKTASSMRDRIIRTAVALERDGFDRVAEELRKVAQPPDEDVASQIERALTGHEFKGKSDAMSGTAPDAGAGLPPPGEIPPPPPEDASQPPQEPAGAPAGAMEKLPEAPPPPPAPTPKEEEGASAKEENPFAGSTTQDILAVLEPLAKKFKERETVRQLSKVDMMMDALNLVAYFPELGEAVGRLIETDSYVGGRLDKIVAKLRGGLKDEDGKDKEEQPPFIDMGTTPPPPPPPPPPAPPSEETGAEVSEKAPPAPGA